MKDLRKEYLSKKAEYAEADRKLSKALETSGDLSEIERLMKELDKASLAMDDAYKAFIDGE